jgi:hypothetical protein
VYVVYDPIDSSLLKELDEERLGNNSQPKVNWMNAFSAKEH